jgi:hypothetical protein
MGGQPQPEAEKTPMHPKTARPPRARLM